LFDISDTIPTHALWVCRTEHAYNSLREAILEKGIENQVIYTCHRLTVEDTIKILPLDQAIEEASQFAQYCKQNCPIHFEAQLYELIKLKDDKRLGPWISSLQGKAASSL